MENKYKWHDNPVRDFFIKNLIYDVDISKDDMYVEIYNNLIIFLEHILINKKDVIYLDFTIKKDKFNNFKVVANNILTALWFSGILPTDSNSVLNENKFIFEGVEYKFNKKTKELKINNI